MSTHNWKVSGILVVVVAVAIFGISQFRSEDDSTDEIRENSPIAEEQVNDPQDDIGDSFDEVHGRVVLLDDLHLEEIQEAFERVGIERGLVGDKLVISHGAESGDVNYYLPLLSSEEESVAMALVDTGACVNITGEVLKPSEEITPEYVEALLPVRLDTIQAQDGLDCYPDQLGGELASEAATVDMEVVVRGTQRPSFDIAYDYEVVLDREKVLSLGMDLEAMETRETQEPIQSWAVVAVPADSSILRQLEVAKRSGNPVVIKGHAVWGYSESQVVVVVALQ